MPSTLITPHTHKKLSPSHPHTPHSLHVTTPLRVPNPMGPLHTQHYMHTTYLPPPLDPPKIPTRLHTIITLHISTHPNTSNLPLTLQIIDISSTIVETYAQPGVNHKKGLSKGFHQRQINTSWPTGTSTVKYTTPFPYISLSESGSKLYTKFEFCEGKNYKNLKNTLIYTAKEYMLTKKISRKVYIF